MSIASVAAPSGANPDVTPLDAAGTLQPLPSQLRQRLEDLCIHKFSRPVEDPRQRLEQQAYAEVKVGDRVIATVSNSGAVTVPNSSPCLKLIRTADGSLLSGPALARHMAEKLARSSGGTIVMADSAATQAQWLARPPLQWTIDYEAMSAFIESNRHRAADNPERTLAVLAAQQQRPDPEASVTSM